MDIIKISNADGKVWLLPQKDLKNALCLYQPSSMKGKALKLFLPYLQKFSFFRTPVYKVLKISECDYCIPEAVKKTIPKMGLEANRVTYAAFLGTPTSVHQKITIQLSDSGRIRGYCKLSNSSVVGEVFLHEKGVLQYLEENNIRNVPKCYYADNIEGTYLFAQSTIKTKNSKVVHRFTKQHEEFLYELATKTRVSSSFEDTDFYRDMNWLEERIGELEAVGLVVEGLRKAIERTKIFSENENSFCMSHGDLTPWNTFSEKDKLFVFDWEYAKYTYPLFIDYFHFFTQSAVFEKRMCAKEIYQMHRSQILRKKCPRFLFEPDEQYLQYLISSISNYCRRDEFIFSDDNKDLVSVWLELIDLILNIE